MFDFESDVLKGDVVMFYSHPGAGISYPAFVLAKGNDSVECLVFSWNGSLAAASHKSGVRHVDNEVFKDPVILSNLLQDGDSGCFELHPNKILAKQLADRLEELEQKVLKGKAKPKPKAEEAPAPEVKPDLSFRMDDEEGPALTEEQKAERKALLEAVR